MAAVALGLAVAGIVLAADAPKTVLQVTMITKVNPQGLALWDITNGAMDDKGDLSGSKLAAAHWAKLAEIGNALQSAGQALSTKSGVLAALPGAKLQDEGNSGASTAADVQRYLDDKPEVFRKHALELQQTGANAIAAAKKHDVKKLAAISEALDEVCESCHLEFWYPKQKKQ
jgi:hypothetical protein